MIPDGFYFLVRREGEDGADIIPIEDLIDPTYESLKLKVLSMAFPEDGEPLDLEDYSFSLTEIEDKFPIKVKSTGDLVRRIEWNASKGYMWMKVTARRMGEVAPAVTMVAPAISKAAPPVVLDAKSAGALQNHKKRKTTLSNTTDTSFAKKAKTSVCERIIIALAKCKAIGIPEPPRTQVALWSDYKNVNSSGFAKALSQLKKDGLVRYSGKKHVALTEAGLQSETVMSVIPPTSNTEVHQQMMALMMPKQQEMFRLLSVNGRVIMTREELARNMNYTNTASSGFAKGLSTLKSLGLLQYLPNQTVQLTDMCFPLAETYLPLAETCLPLAYQTKQEADTKEEYH